MAVTKVTTELIEDNSITHDHIHNSLLVTSSEGISSSNNDVTVPTSLAVSNYVDSAVSSLVDSSPANLDTLNELAAALNDDADFATTVTNSIADKLPLTGGTLTGSLTIPDYIFHDGDTGSYIGFNNPGSFIISTFSVPRIIASAIGIFTYGDLYVTDKITHNGDENTYMRFPSNDTISWHTSGVERMRIDPSGDVNVSGSMSATSLTETSALRFKENIQEDIDSSIIDKLRPVSYDWKENNKKDYGFIAEEVDELNPLLTTKNEDGEMLGIKYTKLIPFLVKKIQEQEKRIIELENGQS